jgi:hypothetical protein
MMWVAIFVIAAIAILDVFLWAWDESKELRNELLWRKQRSNSAKSSWRR